MSSAPQPKIMADEFIDSEEAHPHHELIDGDVYETFASIEHGQVISNIDHALRTALGTRPSSVYIQSLVKITNHKVYRPDLMATCAEPIRYRSRLGDALVNPTLICEVLSDNTMNFDRGTKFHDYRHAIANLNEYLLVNPFKIDVEYHWVDRDGAWKSLDMRPHGDFMLVHLDARLAISDIYHNVL